MDVTVIGGGVSGLVYAICASRAGNSVTLIESNQRVGKKLLLTGAGRCNLTNVNVNSKAYNNPVFVKKIFEEVPFGEYEKFVNSCGIYLSKPDDEGRVYPITYSSASVCDCLRFSAMRSGVKVICNALVEKIKKTKDGFSVCFNGKDVVSKRVVVAVGSSSQATNVNLDQLVGKQFLTNMAPSLAPMKVRLVAKSLSGVRARCLIALKKDNHTIAEELGEVQFRDFGLSGICTFNMSSYVARTRAKGDKSRFDLHIDFLPSFSAQQLKSILLHRIKEGYGDEIFVGLLPNKIAEWIKKQNLSKDIDRYVEKIKNTVFEDANPVDFALSQVTSGGVDVKYLDETLTLPNGITVVGEALDVDGLCGGYNLHFAVVSAIYASKKLSNN